MVEVEAKKVVLKNLAGEYLVPITEPYIAGDGIKIEDNVISADIGEISGAVSDAKLQNKANIDANNFSDIGKNYISGLGMPSKRYIDLTLGATESYYTAPADGWMQAACMGTQGSTYFELTSNEISATASFTGGWARCSIPVRKGQRIQVFYGGTNFQPKIFRFTYAQGAN